MSLFSIIGMPSRQANCAALKAFLEHMPSHEVCVCMQPATIVDPERARGVAPSLSPGELGCYLSHMQALRAFLDSECQVGGTLEDDLHFASLTEALALVADAGAEILHGDAHLVNLDPDFQGRSFDRRSKFVYSRFPGLNASFIMYSRRGAAAWLRALVVNAERDRYLLPADNLFREAGVAYAVPVSTPFFQRREAVGPYASSIADDRVHVYKRRWQEGLPDFIVHYGFRCHMLLNRSTATRTLKNALRVNSGDTQAQPNGVIGVDL